MRSMEERLDQLHRRAKFLQKKKEKRILLLMGSASAALFIAVVSAAIRLTGIAPVSVGSRFAGASLLSESAGGYVLTAVASFTAAVVITLVCLHHKKRKGRKGEKEDEDSKTDRFV